MSYEKKILVQPPVGAASLNWADPQGNEHHVVFAGGKPAWCSEALAVAVVALGGTILETQTGLVTDENLNGMEDADEPGGKAAPVPASGRKGRK